MPGNPTIFRTTNPIDFTQVDGVYVDERRPPGPVRGIGNDIVCVVGEFERGPVNAITAIGSTEAFNRTFGGLGPDASGAFYKGALSLRNKQFGRLRVIRVSNSTQALATRQFADSVAVNVLRVDANSTGAWGNSLSAEIAAATDGVANHFNLRIFRGGVLQEVHRNLDLATLANGQAFPIVSEFVVATRIAIGNGRPANIAAQALTGGSDGTFADADYTGSPSDVRGIELLKGNEASAIRWVFVAERANAAVNASLLALANGTKTKIAIINGTSGNTIAQALTDVALYRSDRVVYCFPWVKTLIPESKNLDLLELVAPNSFAAAACAALAPGRDPAGVSSEPFLSGIRALNHPNLTRDDYISFNEQGVMALQFAAERQRFGFRSGRTTSLDPSLLQIARRTMADFLQESIAAALVHFQNLPLNADNKLQIKGSIEDFLRQQINLGLLPGEADLDFGDGQPDLLPFLVDIVSGNTPPQEAQGIFVVNLRVRIFASMRFIVLRTLIGEGVEVRVDEVQ